MRILRAFQQYASSRGAAHALTIGGTQLQGGAAIDLGLVSSEQREVSPDQLLRELGATEARAVWLALRLQPEGRVLVSHQRGVGDNPQCPAVEAHDQLENIGRIPPVEEQSHGAEDG